jgi:hypothetical protein
MEAVYNKIIETFASDEAIAVFTEANLPQPRTIDIYRGQPDDPDSFEIFPGRGVRATSPSSTNRWSGPPRT